MSRFVVRTLSCWCVAVCAALLVPPVGAAEGAGPPLAQVVPVAGRGSPGYSGDGQAATEARIGADSRLAVGPDGTLYIADSWAKRVRAVDDSGAIDTVPGSRALRSPRTDGPEVNGWQYSPSDWPRAVAVGPDGALYIAGTETIRRLRGGASTKLAMIGPGTVDRPDDIGVDAGGNVYVSGSGKVVRIDRARKVTRIGGGGKLDPLQGDGKPATQARLGDFYPRIAVDRRGIVYIVVPHEGDRQSASLHRIDPDGRLHTVAGGGKPGFAGDGGPAREARLSSNLGGVAVAADGRIYLHDKGNNLVRVIGTDGVITSVAPPLPVHDSYIPADTDLAVGPGGDVYVGVDARVYRLSRNEMVANRGSARAPDYPSRFPDAQPGTVRTVAGTGRRPEPVHSRPITTPASFVGARLRIAVGPDGTRYYSDVERHRVVKLAADGTASVLAGVGEPGFRGDGGEATRAALDTPTGVAVDRDGNVYIADSGNFRLRKVDSAGVITTVAGNGSQGDQGGTFGEEVTVHGDGGPATNATVTPVDVDVAADGSLYLAEAENSRISRITPDGRISTFAGNGDRWMEEADGHPATEASFFHPCAVTVGPNGSVYLLDEDVETIRPAVRMIDPRGIVRTVAGDSYRDEREAGFAGESGPAARAELNYPHDIATGPDGTLYIADTYNARVRAVSAAGTIRTVTGTGRPVDSGDGAAATKASVAEPQTIDVDARGAVHLINLRGDRIREIDGGTISTTGWTATADPSGPAEGTPATKAAVDPTGLAVDRDGTLLIANRIGTQMAVAPNGRLGRVTGRLERAGAVAVGPDGARYAAFGDVVYLVRTDGPPVPVAGGGPLTDESSTSSQERVEPGAQATLARFHGVVDLAMSDRLHIATPSAVYRLEDDGTLTRLYTLRGRAGPLDPEQVNGIAVDRANRLYVAVSEVNRVYRVADGELTTFAGNGSTSNEDDDNGSAATDAALFGPQDVAADRDGNVYIGTFDGIRRVGTDGTIMTVAGNEPGADGSRGAIGPLALDRHGDLYFADHTRNQVKVLAQPARITEPFGWGAVIWSAVGVLAAGVAAWFGLRWWRRRSAPQQETDSPPAADPEPAADAESATEAESPPDTEPAADAESAAEPEPAAATEPDAEAESDGDTEPDPGIEPDGDADSAGDERA